MAHSPSTQDDTYLKLERRLGRVQAQQRLGIEKDHEDIFGQGINFFHPENWYSAHAVIRTTLRLAGLYWRGCKNTERIQVRHNEIKLLDLPSLFDGFTILHISDMHVDMMTGAWIAANIERNRLSRINGYGSHAERPSRTLIMV